MPDVEVPGFYRKLRSHARLFFRKYFESVPREAFDEKGDLFTWWIDKSLYPADRKKELSELWNKQRERLAHP